MKTLQLILQAELSAFLDVQNPAESLLGAWCGDPRNRRARKSRQR
jgi:hypothetical protein